tara:strand:+ start:259 stop:429 length:171 start_codon:yes stop_codon:yes gene_type:complete
MNSNRRVESWTLERVGRSLTSLSQMRVHAVLIGLEPECQFYLASKMKHERQNLSPG